MAVGVIDQRMVAIGRIGIAGDVVQERAVAKRGVEAAGQPDVAGIRPKFIFSLRFRRIGPARISPSTSATALTRRRFTGPLVTASSLTYTGNG